MFTRIWWRFWACPRTVEAVARDFLIVRNPEQTQRVLSDPEAWSENVLTVFQRRIAFIYGLSDNFNVQTTGAWSPAWYRRLLTKTGTDPERAAELILNRVVELARSHRQT